MSTEQVITDLVRAINGHDTAAALSMVTDSVELRCEGVFHLVGSSALLDIMDWMQRLDGSLEIRSLSCHDVPATCRMLERNQWLRTAGIELAAFDAEIRIDGEGRMESLLMRPSGEGAGSEASAAKASLIDWVRSEHGHLRNTLFQEDGTFVYTGHAAGIWRSLLRRYVSRDRKTRTSTELSADHPGAF